MAYSTGEISTDCCLARVSLFLPDSGFKSFSADKITKEYKVLRQNYDKITSITDIESILSKLVTKEVITYREEQKIKAKTNSVDKVKELLSYILGPLKEGYATAAFYIFLDTLESGNMASQELATNLKKSVESCVL